ncbi:MAG: DUF4293 family protein [Bacteroidales bacterium]
MFQRIQSVFIIIAVGLIGSLFFLPMIKFTDGGIIRFSEFYPTLVLTIASFGAGAASIFMYKGRIIQARVCTINALILIGYQILLIVKYIQRVDEMIFTTANVFPTVAAILLFLAIRYILKDEAKVIAANHLR